MKITKDQVLNNLDEIKNYIKEIEEKKVEKKKVKIIIKSRRTGNIIYESEKETIKEAVVEAVSNQADLREANLREADLCEADLCGADLCGADLYGANLCEADLRGANLREADLCEANLRGADLRGAELGEAKFYGRGGNLVIKKENLEGFLEALGFKLE